MPGVLEPPLELGLRGLERRELLDPGSELPPGFLRRVELTASGVPVGRQRVEPTAELSPHVREVPALPLRLLQPPLELLLRLRQRDHVLGELGKLPSSGVALARHCVEPTPQLLALPLGLLQPLLESRLRLLQQRQLVHTSRELLSGRLRRGQFTTSRVAFVQQRVGPGLQLSLLAGELLAFPCGFLQPSLELRLRLLQRRQLLHTSRELPALRLARGRFTPSRVARPPRLLQPLLELGQPPAGLVTLLGERPKPLLQIGRFGHGFLGAPRSNTERLELALELVALRLRGGEGLPLLGALALQLPQTTLVPLRRRLGRLDPLALVAALTHDLVGTALVLRGGLSGGHDSLPLLVDRPDELFRPTLVLARRRLGRLDRPLVVALELDEPALELGHRLLCRLAPLPVGLARVLQLCRCPFALPRSPLGLRGARPLVSALALELSESPESLLGVGLGRGQPALRLRASRLRLLLELFRPRLQGLLRPPGLVPLRNRLFEPPRTLLRLATGGSQQSLELLEALILSLGGRAGGGRRLGLLEPARKRIERGLELPDPRLAGRDGRLCGGEARPVFLELRLEVGERHVAVGQRL